MIADRIVYRLWEPPTCIDAALPPLSAAAEGGAVAARYPNLAPALKLAMHVLLTVARTLALALTPNLTFTLTSP